METTNKGDKMQYIYSVYGSRVHLLLEESVADAHNRALDAWFKAQEDHKKRTGSEWNPRTEPILIDWTKEEEKAFNDVGRIMNLMVEVNGKGLEITEEEITSDYLVKL